MAVTDEIAAAMQATNEVFCSDVVGRRDGAALDRVYTRGARVLPPGASLLEGAEAIRSFWMGAIAGLDLTGAMLATISAEMVGETVLEIGRAELALASGSSVAAKYVVHWKYEDDAWKWDLDIWNMNE